MSDYYDDYEESMRPPPGCPDKQTGPALRLRDLEGLTDEERDAKVTEWLRLCSEAGGGEASA